MWFSTREGYINNDSLEKTRKIQLMRSNMIETDISSHQQVNLAFFIVVLPLSLGWLTNSPIVVVVKYSPSLHYRNASHQQVNHAFFTVHIINNDSSFEEINLKFNYDLI